MITDPLTLSRADSRWVRVPLGVTRRIKSRREVIDLQQSEIKDRDWNIKLPSSSKASAGMLNVFGHDS